MTAPSEQEWRKAIRVALAAGGGGDGVMAAIAPLIERERQQARQEALTEALAKWPTRDGPPGFGPLLDLRDWLETAAAGDAS